VFDAATNLHLQWSLNSTSEWYESDSQQLDDKVQLLVVVFGTVAKLMVYVQADILLIHEQVEFFLISSINEKKVTVGDVHL
jgi:hypothetical protein